MLHQIGSGVLGPVFRTYEPQRDRLVAVKAFRLDLVPEDVARLADALRSLVAAGLDQPGIVPVLDAGLEGSTAFLAMEYVAGETLDVAFRHLAPAPLARAVPVLSTMAKAIDAATAAGFGHGALHPRDVFLRSGSDDVLITGFGVVPALELIGYKPPARRPYAAPERIAGHPADLRADVYSLGAIAYELLTRRRPAGPGDQDGVPPTGTSPEQRELVHRALAKALAENPGDRFPSASAFVEALSAAVEGADAAANAPPLFELLAHPPEPVQLDQPAPDVPAPAVQEDTARPEPSPGVEVPKVQDRPIERPVKARRVEPRIQDWDVPPLPEARPERPAVSRDRRPLPPALFASVASESEARPPYPWGAIAAVAVACITLGGVVGYQLGIRHPAAAGAAVSEPVSAGTDTDVKVPPASNTPAVPAASAPPPAADAATPPAAAPPAEPATGRISVHSKPSGAAITINGRGAGTTPQTFRDLPLGTVTIEATRRGYAPKREQVDLTAASPSAEVTLTLTLTPRSAAPAATADSPAAKRGSAAPKTAAAPVKTGSVNVITRPPGAKVTIDGKPSGTTPVRVEGLSVGVHTVRVELAGYRTVPTRVTIKAGTEQRVTLTLEQSGGTAGRTTGRQ